MSEIFDPGHCAELQDELAGLRDEEEFWDAQLEDPPGNLRRGQIAARLRGVRERMRTIERLLENCTGIKVPRQLAFVEDAGPPSPMTPTPTIFTIYDDGSGRQALFQPARGPKWSPDGRRIAFEQVFLDWPGGPPRVRVFAFGGPSVDLGTGWNTTWSPTGDRIAFVDVNAANGFSIFVAPSDGTGTRTELRSEATGPAWSPTADVIAFEVMTTGGISIVDVDTGAETQLTSGRDFGPVWSPDGTKLAFTREGASIAVVDVQSAQVTVLSAESDSSPAWAPDGTRIAFQTTRSGSADIYVMDAVDGGGQTNVSNDAGSDLGPAWSPGERVAFTRYYSGPPLIMPALYTVDPDNPADQVLVERVPQPWSVFYPMSSEWRPHPRR